MMKFLTPRRTQIFSFSGWAMLNFSELLNLKELDQLLSFDSFIGLAFVIIFAHSSFKELRMKMSLNKVEVVKKRLENRQLEVEIKNEILKKELENTKLTIELAKLKAQNKESPN